MKAEIVRFSSLSFAASIPPITSETILKAKGLPADARVIHILPIKSDEMEMWEVLIASESYPDRSVWDLADSVSLSLIF
jgi:hypothetical protein